MAQKPTTYLEYLVYASKRDADNDFPDVVTTSDPMMVRFSKLSLLVNDTNFHAKIKTGLAWSGFMIYVTGIGTPVFEYQMNSNKTRTENRDGAIIKLTQNEVEDNIEEEAALWLDKLEAKIATTNADNGLRKAIDRLCWQLHYDITATNTPDTVIAEKYGFSDDIHIDRVDPNAQGTAPDYQRGYTIVDTVEYLLCEELNNDTNTLTTSLQTQTRYLTGCLCYPDSITIYHPTLNNTSATMSSGAIQMLKDTVSVMDSHFNASSISSGTATYLTYGTAYWTGRALRETDGANGEYTISLALRERSGGELSVSGATYEQTQLEDRQFTEISDTKLGAFGVNNHRTLYDTIGTNADGNATSNTGTLFYEVLHRAGTRNLNSAIIETDSPIGNVISSTSAISTINTNVATIKDRIGTRPSVGSTDSGTLWYDLMHNAAIWNIQNSDSYQGSSIYGMVKYIYDNT